VEKRRGQIGVWGEGKLSNAGFKAGQKGNWFGDSGKKERKGKIPKGIKRLWGNRP